MALTETSIFDQIMITENGVIHCRQINRIKRDGQVIARNYNKITLQPGQDLTGLPARVVAVCNLIWTQEVIDAYQLKLSRRLA